MKPAMLFEPGTTGAASIVVASADLATALNHVNTDGFPAVLATPRMIGLMELAAARAMHSVLGSGELSVGVGIEVTHSGNPERVRVSAEATFVAMEGKLFVFDITARDNAGEINTGDIGRGTHRRAVVSAARLLQGAQRRCSASG
jgi:fluoroacetyl-CoA thioesterase